MTKVPLRVRGNVPVVPGFGTKPRFVAKDKNGRIIRVGDRVQAYSFRGTELLCGSLGRIKCITFANPDNPIIYLDTVDSDGRAIEYPFYSNEVVLSSV